MYATSLILFFVFLAFVCAALGVFRFWQLEKKGKQKLKERDDEQEAKSTIAEPSAAVTRDEVQVPQEHIAIQSLEVRRNSIDSELPVYTANARLQERVFCVNTPPPAYRSMGFASDYHLQTRPQSYAYSGQRDTRALKSADLKQDPKKI